jgi:hypothetical protein
MAWTNQWIDRIAQDEPHKLERRLAWDNWSTHEAFGAWLMAPPECERSEAEACQRALADCKR